GGRWHLRSPVAPSVGDGNHVRLRRGCVIAPARPGRSPSARVNNQIQAPQVRLVDEAGTARVVSRTEALAAAAAAGLDLVEVAPTADPPVCRMLDYGKWAYEAQQRARANRRSSPPPPRELRFSPTIGDHDFDVK